jgi:hypothetical protein
MNYDYWNNFVDNWRVLPHMVYTNPTPLPLYHLILGWTNPNLIPLMNSSTLADYSLNYLPEPWWGNNGTHILNSVVVNYNPWTGGNSQHHNASAGLYGHANYADFVNKSVLNGGVMSGTNNWHRRRSRRIFDALKSIKDDVFPNDNLENHLSVELIPWHTPNAQSAYFCKYKNNSLIEIYNNCFVFAANESMRINNQTLRNKVIVRLSGSETTKLLNNLSSIGIVSNINIGPTYTPRPTLGNAGYVKFQFNSIPNVDFISIWGKYSHNDFPSNLEMQWIFGNII